MLYVFKQSLAEQENGTLKYLFGLKKTKIPTIDIEKIKKDIACLIDEEKPIKDQAIGMACISTCKPTTGISWIFLKVFPEASTKETSSSAF